MSPMDNLLLYIILGTYCLIYTVLFKSLFTHVYILLTVVYTVYIST